jgi:hypothetical protein
MADDLKLSLEAIRARQIDYALANDYYYGRHKLAFATEKFRSAFGSLLKAFADNLCAVVVDTVADRLQVTGFADEAGNEGVSSAAEAIWRVNRMDRRAGETHGEALRSGDAFVIVWPDAQGVPRLYPQAAHLCTVTYDDDAPGTIGRAAKLWHDAVRELWRLTLYYPDRIEKYAYASKVADFPSGSGAFQPYAVSGEAWPLPNPYGRTPIFHFANNAPTGQLGRSELADVIPLQDGLNKSVTDMLVAMEFVALPQRWVTGLEVDLDETTGRPAAPFVPGADRVWSVAAPDARFGQFDQANLGQFVAVQEAFRVEIARVSRTPLHHLMPTTSAFPSGEAMKTAEQPLLAKVKDRQLGWGNVWEDAMQVALAMTGVTVAGLSCNWTDPAPRNERELVETLLLKKQLGVSDNQLLREAGYTEEQITTFAQERETQQAALGEAMLTAFDRNQVAGVRGKIGSAAAQ